MNNELPVKHISCPNCGAQLNPAEVNDQECFTCGWPDPWDKEADDETED